MTIPPPAPDIIGSWFQASGDSAVLEPVFLAERRFFNCQDVKRFQTRTQTV